MVLKLVNTYARFALFFHPKSRRAFGNMSPLKGSFSSLGLLQPNMERILTYWFPCDEDGTQNASKGFKLWYAGSIEVDQYIRENFAGDWALAQTGKLTEWWHNALNVPDMF